MTEINFHNLRSHDSSKNKGFEELCSQLARLEFVNQKEWKFIKKGGSADGGVECYWVLPDQSEYCWQAKYVDDLDAALNQIDSSIKQALEKHPKLIKYYVCLSINLADSRQSMDVTQKVKWDTHLRKWNQRAAEKNMQIDFVLWGKFELIDKLSKNNPEYIGRRQYWFNETIFSQEWFHKELDSVLKDAGPRYTPELHIALPKLTEKFYAVSRDTHFYDRLLEYENEFGRLIFHLSFSKEITKKYPAFEIQVKQAQEYLRNLKRAFLNFTSNQLLKSGDFESLRKQGKDLLSLGNKALHLISDFKSEESKKRIEEGPTKEACHTDPFNHIEHYLVRLIQKLIDFLQFIDSEQEAGLCEQRFMILKGAAGTGKTHTLYDFAKARLAEELPTVMLLGQYFSSDIDPWAQVLQKLGFFGNIKRDEFLGALDSAAEASNSMAVIIIDALNEGRGREFWRQRLTSFVADIKKFPRLALIVSTRITYCEQTIPKNIRDVGVVVCKHPGFEGIEYKATLKFFEYYHIKLPDAPLLNPEFSNPLFLKVFCQSINEAGLTEVPKGFGGLTNVFNFYLDNKYKKIAEGLAYDPKENILPNVVSALAAEMIQKQQRWIMRNRVKKIVEQIANDKTKDFQDKLFFKLLFEGIIIEFEGYDINGKTHDAIGFTYERFSDHIIVNHLLSPLALKGDSPKKLRKKFLKHPVLRKVIKGEYLPKGWIEALCIQLPERTGVELFDITKQIASNTDKFLARFHSYVEFYAKRFIKNHLHWRFIRPLQSYISKRDNFRNRYKYEFNNSISWREPSSFTEKTIYYLNVFTDSYDEVLEQLLTVTTISGHPLNAKRFHRNMLRFSMPERDSYLGKYLMYAYPEPSAVTRLIDWAWQENHEHISDDVIELCIIAITWFLISSNRELRDFSTKALVNLLQNRLIISLKILDLFKEVDDLYLQERLYAAIYGAILLSKNDIDIIKKIASKVYELQFKNNRPLRHLLLRDYARLIIEMAIKKGACDKKWDAKKFSPPYQSDWPLAIPSKKEIDSFFLNNISAEEKYSTRGLYSIQYSVTGGGDFEKYNIQNQTYWYDIPIDALSPVSNLQRIENTLSRYSEEAKEAFHNALNNILSVIAKNSFSTVYYNQKEGRMSDLFFDKNEHLKTNVDGVNDLIVHEEEKIKNILGETNFKAIRHTIYQYLSDPTSIEKFPVYNTDNISRWVCKRIFDLGWTSKLFDDFDSAPMYDRRQKVKIERIGKKYGWIALNEIKAVLFDHLKFRTNRHIDDVSNDYKGAWQLNARDIDPTIVVKNIPDLNYKTSPQCWWQPHKINFQDESIEEQLDWIENNKDIPILSSLLEMQNPNNQTTWLLLQGYYSWYEKKRTYDNGRDIPYRNLWLHIHSFMVKKEHFEDIKKIILASEHTWDWLPNHQLELYQIYVGEFPLFGAAESYDEKYEALKSEKLSFPIYSTTVWYNKLSDYDGSAPNTSAPLPSKNLINGMELQRVGKEYDYYQANQLAVYCPHTKSYGPMALIASRVKLIEYLNTNNLVLIWGIQGEKMLFENHTNTKTSNNFISGFYYLIENSLIEGSIKRHELS